MVHSELAEDAEFRRRFAREVAAAQRVSGAFTAPVLGADPDSDPPWLATLYVPGPCLSDVLSAHGALPEGSVRLLGAGLLEALESIHSSGLVHRDLKPSNVLLAADGPRVIDFGISVAPEFSALTRTGSIVGTPGFMSPEQLVGKPVGPASDIFSLGALLVFAATGASAFGQAAAPALMYRIVHDQARLDAVPEALRTPLGRALAKDPDDRPGVAQLLAELLPHGVSQSELGGLGERRWLPSAIAATLSRPDAATVISIEGGAPERGEEKQGTWLGRVLGIRRRLPTVPSLPVPPAESPAGAMEAPEDVAAPPAPPAGAPGAAPDPRQNIIVPPVLTQTPPGPVATRVKPAAASFEGFVLDTDAVSLDCLVDGERTLAVVVSPDSATPTVWDLNAQAQTGVLAGHTDAVRDVCCVTLEGRSAAVTAGDDGTIRVWSLADHTLLNTILYPRDSFPVQKVFCTELDGIPAVVAGTGGSRLMRVYDLRTFSEIPIAGPMLNGSRADLIGCTRIDGRPVVLTIAADRMVRVWDLTTHAPVHRLISPLEDTWDACCIEVGDRTLVICGGRGEGGQLPVWALTAGKRPQILLQDGNYRATGAVRPAWVDGRPVAVTGDDHVRVWDAETFSEVATLSLPGRAASVRDLACIKIGGHSCVVAAVGTVPTGPGEPWIHRVHVLSLTAALSTLDWPAIASPAIQKGRQSRGVQVAQVPATKGLAVEVAQRHILTGRGPRITCMDWSLVNGRAVAVLGGPGGMGLWDVAAGARLGSLSTSGSLFQAHALSCATLSGRPVVAAGDASGLMRVWDLAERQEHLSLQSQRHEVLSLICTNLADRPLAIVGGRDDEVRVWDLATQQQTMAFGARDVVSLAIAEIGGHPTVLACDEEGRLTLWDLRDGSRTATLRSEDWPVGSLAHSTAGRHHIAVLGGTRLHLWDLTDLRRRASVGDLSRAEYRTVHGTRVEDVPLVLATPGKGVLQVWNLAARKPIGEAALLESVEADHMGEGLCALTTVPGLRGTILVAVRGDGAAATYDLTLVRHE